MPAISNLSAGEGFARGFGVADQYLNNQENMQQRRQAIDMAGQQQAFQNDLATKSDARAGEAMELQRKQTESMDSYRGQQEQHLQHQDRMSEAQLKIHQQQARTAQIVSDTELSAKKKAALREEALQFGSVAMNGGAPFPLALHDKLIKNGMPALSPYSYMDPKFVSTQAKLGTIVEAVKGGNLKGVNQPDSIAAINEAYADQIQKGVGDFNGAMGGNVVAKRITQLEAGPKGSVIAHVNVQLDNGKSYDAPITVARSSDEHDPVKLHDAGMMLDDVMGRYQLSQVAKTQEYQQSVRTMFDAASNASLTAAGKSSSLPANAQMIEYLMNRGGMKFDQAKDMVMNSVDNPEKAAREFAGVILKNQPPYRANPITPEQALAQARALFVQPQQPAAPGATAAPQPATTQPTAPQQSAAPVQVKSDAEYNALPSGAVFVDPTGKTRRKP